ncbi:MAG: bile acid:sodium symporter family protein [Leadbetterella sp.]
MDFLRKNIYTLVIIVIVAIAYFFPENFIEVQGFQLKNLIKPCLQIIMLGMGATMGWEDFSEVIKSPKKVVIGLVCQFTIMPLLGFGLASMFDFDAEISAGIVLIGCSPSGLASNVMAMLSKANVALSITITTLATLLAPVLTPALMKLLGGGMVQIEFWDMFIDMIKLVLLPVGLGVILKVTLPSLVKKIEAYLPLISMVGIAYIVVVVTAGGNAALNKVGFLLIFVVFLHNVFGFFLGYVSAKLLNMNEADARAVSLEVGMQNGGLASSLANEMGKLATLGLAASIFAPLMNITGSILSNYWANKKS